MTTAAGQTSSTDSPSGNGNPQPHEQLDAAQLLKMASDMMLIRRFEERCAQSYQRAAIGGFCHVYIGQEAVAVGTVGALNDDDPIITAYRDHGHALARGMDPGVCMAEMYGKIDGCAKGKGGSMHMFDKPNHMYGGHAIVGGQAPLGVGLAFAIQYNKEDKVCLCYFGDGALNQGAVHEAMNLAAIWKLPIIFVLENNLYSMGTAIERGTSMAHDLSAKANAYGMRYAECDGLNVLNVYDCMKNEVDRSRTRGGDPETGDGPAFVNVVTYRYQGHSMSDPQKYRTKEEVAEKQSLDPIDRLRTLLIDGNVATSEQLDELDKKAKEDAKASIKYAEQSDPTPMDELYRDVYVNPFPPFEKGDLPPFMR
jgi:pyruvate dehydrogenase E1 component alpha subunit